MHIAAFDKQKRPVIYSCMEMAINKVCVHVHVVLLRLWLRKTIAMPVSCHLFLVFNIMLYVYDQEFKDGQQHMISTFETVRLFYGLKFVLN